MRDPNRIDPILARLRAAWIARPDLRLGQLLVGSLPMPAFYASPSDDAWMADRMRRLFNAECAEFGAADAPIVWPVDTDALDRSGCARRMDDRDKLIATLAAKLAEAKRLGLEACHIARADRDDATEVDVARIAAALEAL